MPPLIQKKGEKSRLEQHFPNFNAHNSSLEFCGSADAVSSVNSEGPRNRISKKAPASLVHEPHFE